MHFRRKEEGTVNISNLDRTMYADMMGAEDGTYENALQKINAGDFITLYTSSEEISRKRISILRKSKIIKKILVRLLMNR